MKDLFINFVSLLLLSIILLNISSFTIKCLFPYNSLLKAVINKLFIFFTVEILKTKISRRNISIIKNFRNIF